MAKLHGQHYKGFEYLGYRIEYSRLARMWFVIDWDYEVETVVGVTRTKLMAMELCERRHGIEL